MMYAVNAICFVLHIPKYSVVCCVLPDFQPSLQTEVITAEGWVVL